jgi:hypothetical protein
MFKAQGDLNMDRKNIPTLLLEQYLLGELPEAADIKENDPEIALMIEKLKDSNKEMLSIYPPEIMGKQIESQLELNQQHGQKLSKKKIINFLLRSAPLLAAAVFLIIIGLLPFKGETPPAGEPGQEITRLKSTGPHLLIFRKTDIGAELLNNETYVRAGDLLQVKYNASSARYGAILSIDGRGIVTLHYPEQPGLAAPLEQGQSVSLPYSYALDDAPYFEQFIFLTSNELFSTEEVFSSLELTDGSLEALSQLKLTDSIRISRVTLYKEN